MTIFDIPFSRETSGLPGSNLTFLSFQSFLNKLFEAEYGGTQMECWITNPRTNLRVGKMTSEMSLSMQNSCHYDQGWNPTGDVCFLPCGHVLGRNFFAHRILKKNTSHFPTSTCGFNHVVSNSLLFLQQLLLSIFRAAIGHQLQLIHTVDRQCVGTLWRRKKCHSGKNKTIYMNLFLF